MVDNKRKHKYTNSRNNTYSFSKKKESEAKEIFYWCIEHYKFWIALFSIFGGICVACYKFGMFISDVILSLSVPADTTIQLPAINTVVIIGITILFIFLIIKQSPFHIQLNF